MQHKSGRNNNNCPLLGHSEKFQTRKPIFNYAEGLFYPYTGLAMGFIVADVMW